jgi:PTH1 family peptidyl-tRNA hydrolase
MHLIVGLGNPGKQYDATRHNLGFNLLDLLAGGEDWQNKYDAHIIKTDSSILAKPQLFMNLSGKSVAQILKYHPSAQLIVVHDELDLPLGSLKIVKNSSAAGHNGVQSIIDEIGTKDFVRIRLGINNPETKGEKPGDAYVLERFTEKESEIIKEVLIKAQEAVEVLQTDGMEIAQSKFNG